MNNTQEICQDSITLGWNNSISEGIRWKSVKSLNERKKQISGETSPIQESSSSEVKGDSAEHKLWDNLEEIWKWPFCINGLHLYILSSSGYRNTEDIIEGIGCFDSNFYPAEQTEFEEWKDTAAVGETKRFGVRKVHIKDRTNTRHVAMEKELQTEEDDWVDTAAFTPKRVGSCKVRIKERRHLRATTLPDEFTDQD